MAELTYKDKIFRHKLAVIYRTIMVVVLVVAIVIICKVQIENRVFKEVEILEKYNKVGTEDSEYLDFQNHFLTYSKDGISSYDMKGKQIWNKTYEMQQPIVKTNGSYVVCGDYKGNLLYIMNEKGITGEVDTNMPIIDLSISAKGVVAATLQDGETIWVKLYSESGTEISDVKTTMKRSGYPLATAISADNVKLAVSYLKAQGSGIQTSLAFYNFGNVGQNKTDHLVSGKDFNDEVIPFLEYANENVAIALSDEQLLFFKGKEKPVLDKKVKIEEQVKGIYYNESNVALVFYNSEGKEQYRIDLYNLNGDKVFSNKFDIEYQNIIIEKDAIVIYSDSKLLLLNKRGLVKYEGDLGGDFIAIIPTESMTKYLVIRKDKIEMVRLQ